MKNKIFIGTIIAVVILVLVSFTGVVGYSSVESNSVKASPLFNVRINKAIGEESKDIACKYVGKGITLPFPERDDRTVLTQRVFDRFSKMDDNKLERFIAYIFNYARKDNRFNGVNPDKIREALYLVRDSDKPIPIFNTTISNVPLTLMGCPTFHQCQWTIGYGLKGFLNCILLLFIFPIAFIVWCFEDLSFASAFIICIGETTDCSITLRKLS